MRIITNRFKIPNKDQSQLLMVLEWITRELAQEVFYIKDKGKLIAYMELSSTNTPYWKGTVFNMPKNQLAGLNTENTIALKRLTVHPDYRRHGLAKKLIKLANSQAQKSGNTLIWVVLPVLQLSDFYISLGSSFIGQATSHTNGIPLQVYTFKLNLDNIS